MKTDKVTVLLKKAALEFDRISNALLEQYQLTTPQYKVMKYLHEHQEVRLIDMEKYYSMSHPTLIGIVQNLEKKGLVTYQENPHHARSRFIVATEAASGLMSQMEGISQDLEDQLTVRLTATERQRLVVLLRKMLNLIEE